MTIKSFLVRSATRAAAVCICLPGLLFTVSPRTVWGQEDVSSVKAVEEIVVTALRRERKLQEVPAAVSAFDADALRRLGIYDTESLVRSAPSLSFVPVAPGESMIAIRGLTPSFGLGATVGVYVDETPFEIRTDVFTATPNVEIFDVNRIEVLRGPQGTLYGASSLGGTVRYIMNQPDSKDFEGNIEVGVTSVRNGEEGYSGKGVINIPVSDNFALRAVGAYDKFAGYIDRYTPTNLSDPAPNDALAKADYNDTDLYYFRIAGLLETANDWSITPSFTYQKRESNGMFFSDTNRGPYQTGSSIGDEPTSTEMLIGNLTINKEFEFGTLVSSTSYLRRNADTTVDYTPISFNFFGLEEAVTNRNPTETETVVQELRLSSKNSGQLGWTIGAYFSDTDQTITEIFDGQELADFARTLVGDAPVPNSPRAYSFLQINDDRQVAGFAELSYAITDTVELVAGTRVSRLSAGLSNSCVEAASFAVFCAGDFPTTTAKKTNISPRVSVNISAADDMLFYVSASRGFRQGGPNFPLPSIPSLPCELTDFFVPAYESDSVWSYEAGAKTQFWNHRLTANAAVYQVDQSGIQLTVADPGCFSLFVANTGDARTQGAELELSLQPAANLLFSGHVSYNDAKFVSVPDAFGLAAGFMEGDNVPNVPRWAYSLAGEYRWSVGRDWGVFSRAIWQHVGKSPVELGSGPNDNVPAYEIVNAQIGVSNDRYEIAVFIRNLFDDLAILQFDRSVATTVPSVFEGRNYSAPRTIGVSLRTYF